LLHRLTGLHDDDHLFHLSQVRFTKPLLFSPVCQTFEFAHYGFARSRGALVTGAGRRWWAIRNMVCVFPLQLYTTAFMADALWRKVTGNLAKFF